MCRETDPEPTWPKSNETARRAPSLARRGISRSSLTNGLPAAKFDCAVSLASVAALAPDCLGLQAAPNLNRSASCRQLSLGLAAENQTRGELSFLSVANGTKGLPASECPSPTPVILRTGVEHRVQRGPWL